MKNITAIICSTMITAGIMLILVSVSSCRSAGDKLHILSNNAMKREAQSKSQNNDGGVSDKGKVYDPSECVGTVIAGKCHGKILPSGEPPQTCHGKMLNGECIGTIF